MNAYFGTYLFVLAVLAAPTVVMLLAIAPIVTSDERSGSGGSPSNIFG